MREDSKIGFTYPDLAVANLMNIVFSQGQVPTETQIFEGLNVALRCGHETTLERLAKALHFVKQRQQVYAAYTPVNQIVAQILENHDYFPENPEDFEHILFGYPDEFTEEQKELLTAHSELLEFWQAYGMHRRSVVALGALTAAYGTEHTAVFKDEEYPCLYHRGMEDVNPEIQRIVDVYNHYKTVLGITPALLTAENLAFPPLADLLFDVSGELVVNVPTLAGRIWFEGAPSNELPGGVKLQEV